MTESRKADLVLVGGGHSHVQVLRAFAMDPPPGARVTLVVDTPVAVYSGMVPGFVAGQYRAEELEIDVVPLARRARARVVIAKALRIDAAARLIQVAERAPLRYDVASIDIGSTIAGLDLPGVRETAVPTRPIAELVRRTDSLVERVRARPRGTPFHVVVVGGGAGGVELAFTLWQRIDAGNDTGIGLSLVHAWPELLAGYPRSLIARVHRNAETRGIRISSNRRAVEVKDSAVCFEDGGTVPFDALVWVTGAVSHPLFVDSGLPTEPRGFVRTRSTLQVEGYDDLFAVGDCATMTEFPKTPKAGVYAVRQGPFLIDNLRAWLERRPLRRYRPQGDFLTLLNLGDGTALGAKWGRSFEGAWVMRLKDRIDRGFMRKFQVLDREGAVKEEFQRLPDMSSGMEILCGGCAAKVGQSALERALSRLAPRPRDDSVKLGLAAPDDAAAFETPKGEIIVSSIDAFRAFTDDPYLIGRVAAVNALSDIQAKGAVPRYALALVAVPRDLPEIDSEEILYQVLAGARFVFDSHGVSLVGGHTTTAPELLVGFSVDGFSRRAELLSIDRLEPGDQLMLTKRLGTGIVLHADMLGRASGRWLLSCFESMLTSNGEASAIALELGASAVTDVTGFGLAGHLGAMLRASGVSAVLDLAELPVLPGALELIGQGFRSTSHAENSKAKKGIAVRPDAAADPRVELLFDPQTSGGLLFGLKPSRVQEALERLEQVSWIGEVGPAKEASIEVVSRRGSTEAALTRRRR
jgi:selenide,water dikinase